MNRQIKHTALFITGFFFLSILFQSVHVVWHYGHEHHDDHTACHDDAKSSDKQTMTLSQYEEPCDICDYSFVTSELAVISILNEPVLTSTYFYHELVVLQLYHAIYQDDSPRAPPVCQA